MEIERAGQFLIIASKRGEVVFVPANVWNRPTWERPVKVLNILFGMKHIGVSLVEHERRTEKPSSALKASFSASSAAMQEILNALTLLSGDPLAAKAGRLLAEALLLGVARIVSTPPSVNSRKGRTTYENVCSYLHEHFHQAITRESVAEVFRLNPNHLSRLFKREGALGFNHYLTSVRIDRAKYQLQHHDIKLDSVARNCGFRDTAYFCRVFKERTNRTPGQYRIEARSVNS